MEPCIFYRESLMEDDELKAARKYFPCYSSRIHVPKETLVIGRYSVLPFYREQEYDFQAQNCKLINSYRMHNWIADIGSWANDDEKFLGGFTPQTWDRLEDIPEEGPFVLKGQTNSRKHQWNTHMFAKNKKEAIDVYGRLLEDSLIGQQKIYIRKYIPFKRLDTGINGLPITKEYRVFSAYGKFLSAGYYWASHSEDLEIIPSVSDLPMPFVESILEKVGMYANFSAVDFAQDENGIWWIVEINDGQMAGLSLNKPEDLYSNLRNLLDNLNKQDSHTFTF